MRSALIALACGLMAVGMASTSFAKAEKPTPAAGAPAAKPAQCRDAKGRFMKCAAEKPKRCRDAKGRFAKCGTPGAKPDNRIRKV